MLCADHGPCVSGAHNTIVTARAGKDLVSSLVSGKNWEYGVIGLGFYRLRGRTLTVRKLNSELLKQGCSQLVQDLVVPLMMLLDTSRMPMTG